MVDCEIQDSDDMEVSDQDVFAIRNRLQLLCQAHINARDHMTNGSKTFQQCCQMAIDTLGPLGNVQITNASRVVLLFARRKA